MKKKYTISVCVLVLVGLIVGLVSLAYRENTRYHDSQDQVTRLKNDISSLKTADTQQDARLRDSNIDLIEELLERVEFLETVTAGFTMEPAYNPRDYVVYPTTIYGVNVAVTCSQYDDGCARLVITTDIKVSEGLLTSYGSDSSASTGLTEFMYANGVSDMIWLNGYTIMYYPSALDSIEESAVRMSTLVAEYLSNQ